MTHPEDLLAEYVDGTLGPEERARVDAHLAGCERCRDEVAAAGLARAAVAALPEVDAPSGIALEVRRRVRGTGRAGGFAMRAGATAAAAAIVGVLVWVGMSGGPDTVGGDAAGEQTSAPAAEGGGRGGADAEDATTAESAADSPTALTSASAYPKFRVSDTSYDPELLAELAPRLAEEAVAAIDAGFPPTARDFYASFDLRDLDQRAGTAISCVTGTVAPEGIVSPFLIEEAAFRDEPAYLAVFLQGPDADAPYDRVTLVAVSREGCAPLHYAFQKL